jgi:hypothetical protein
MEILGPPVAAHAGSTRPHDVQAARELLHDRLPDLPRVRAIVGDQAYLGLATLAARKHVTLDVKAPPPGARGFVPIRPLYRIEHAFAALAPAVAVEVEALGYARPTRLGLPLGRLTIAALRRAVIAREIAATISGTTTWR